MFEAKRDVRRKVLRKKGFDERHVFGQSLWEVDHILPVDQGGGCAPISNLRSLCYVCHRYGADRGISGAHGSSTGT